jgi:hypothetical protein
MGLYAGEMDEPNQADAPAPALAPIESAAPPPSAAPARSRRGLIIWLVGLLLLGVGGLILELRDLPAMIAFAGLFIVAQAADEDPRWFGPYFVLSAVVPVGGGVMFAYLAGGIIRGDAPLTMRIAAGAFSIAAAIFSIATLLPAVSMPLAARLFGAGSDSHVARLTARVVALTLLLSLPGSLVFPRILEPLLERPGGLIETRGLGGELIGYIVLALAAVGFLIRRDARGTLERLGLRRPTLRDLALIAFGTLALFVLNGGAEWLQHRFFLASWAHDQHTNQELVRGLTLRQTLLLGASAGIGEEITMRGALQPRLGLLLTSLFFAALHVQYSWFGMATILLIGLVLGYLRQRAGTTVSIGVHALYDIAAVAATWAIR